MLSDILRAGLVMALPFGEHHHVAMLAAVMEALNMGKRIQVVDVGGAVVGKHIPGALGNKLEEDMVANSKE